MSHTIYLALGTNLGRRRANLRQALWALNESVMLAAISPVYETAPWGVVDQPDYLNMCVGGETLLEPRPLLAAIKAVERRLGRTPGLRWEARLIDIDILFYDDLVYRDETLTIPHPRLGERAFVLAPLADIAPSHQHPVTGETVLAMLGATDASGVKRLADPLFDAPQIS